MPTHSPKYLQYAVHIVSATGGPTEFSGELQIASDSYGYMRLTHILAVCWGMPITRRQIAADDVKGKRDSADCTHEGKLVPSKYNIQCAN